MIITHVHHDGGLNTERPFHPGKCKARDVIVSAIIWASLSHSTLSLCTKEHTQAGLQPEVFLHAYIQSLRSA